MSCGRIRRLIQSHVDGAATGEERQAVDAHVAACGECARLLAESRRLVGLLSSMPARRVSESFDANLLAAVRNTPPHSQSAAWWERFRLRFEWRLRMPAMVAASSLAAGVCAFLVGAPLVHLQEVKAEQHRYVAAVVAQHQQLEQAKPARARVESDVLEASIELNTGAVIE